MKKLEPHRWGRGQPRAGCRWHVGSCSSRRFPHCRSPSTAPSGTQWIDIHRHYHRDWKGVEFSIYATQILFFDFLWNINIINEYEGRMVGDTLSLLPFTFLDSMWTRLRPSSSNTLRALESPTMPLKIKVDLFWIMEHLTLCRGNITAVLNTPSRLRKW